jgi:putative effector of murein hydrolase
MHKNYFNLYNKYRPKSKRKSILTNTLLYNVKSVITFLVTCQISYNVWHNNKTTCIQKSKHI